MSMAGWRTLAADRKASCPGWCPSLARLREKPLSETIKHIKAEWLAINPFLSDQEALNLEKNPPPRNSKQPEEKDHDYPMD